MHYDCIRFSAETDNCLSAEHPTHLEINLMRGRRLLAIAETDIQRWTSDDDCVLVSVGCDLHDNAHLQSQSRRVGETR